MNNFVGTKEFLFIKHPIAIQSVSLFQIKLKVCKYLIKVGGFLMSVESVLELGNFRGSADVSGKVLGSSMRCRA